MATAGSNRAKLGIGVVGVVAILGLAGGLGHQAGTQMASESRAAATSTASSAPTTHRSESLRAATAPSSTTSTSSTPVAPPPPVPALTMTCPAGGTVASPVFGQQITATAPYTVVIDYGDGDVYTNDDQHLAAIFSHTYQRAGTFTVNAHLSDATGQSAAATCAYSWTAPAPRPAPAPVAPNNSGGTSSGGSTSHVPAGGPTAICNDGTPSYSQHRQGTCSHHGGVAQWLI
jgi:hypothetical protein